MAWYLTPRSSVVGQAIMDGQQIVAAVPSGEANALLLLKAPLLRRLLTKSLPALIELHAQGIGCPDCPKDADTESRPEACPFVREVDSILAVLPPEKEK